MSDPIKNDLVDLSNDFRSRAATENAIASILTFVIPDEPAIKQLIELRKYLDLLPQNNSLRERGECMFQILFKKAKENLESTNRP